MPFVYDAGLRIRPPEPMPECREGMSPQEYFALAFAQCSIESATSPENASGDSAPTPFNLGQVQQDIQRNTADIDALETDVGDLEVAVGNLNGRLASGVVPFDAGDMQVVVALPSSTVPGNWAVSVTPMGGEGLGGLHISSLTPSGFTVTFDAAASSGSLSWVAIKS